MEKVEQLSFYATVSIGVTVAPLVMLRFDYRQRLILCFLTMLLVACMFYLGNLASKLSSSNPSHADRIAEKRLMDQSTQRIKQKFVKPPGSITTRLHTESCSEVTHAVFIKIHKTGSGTLASVLIHFGVERNLTFALSKFGTYFSMDPILKEHILPIPEGKHYDLLVTHSTYNSDTIKQVFPADTKIIATVREPFSQFISSFYFFPQYKTLLPKHLQKTSNTTRKIEWLLFNGYQRLVKETNAGSFFFNLVSLKFGISYNYSHNRSHIRTYIDNVLNKDLDFVLIQEYFDESLVLLKRRFCWKLSDIVYRSYHVNPHVRTDNVYTEKLLKMHKDLAVAEYMIYDHFHKKFWEIVWAEGPDLFHEVRVFKAILRRIQSFCAHQPPNDEVLVLPSSPWNGPFTILGRRCQDMQIKIPTLLSLQEKKQNGV